MEERYEAEIGGERLRGKLISFLCGKYKWAKGKAENHIREDQRKISEIEASVARGRREREEYLKDNLSKFSAEEMSGLLHGLVEKLFSEGRRKEGEAFGEVSGKELALLEWGVKKYCGDGRFVILDSSKKGGDRQELKNLYAIIRHDLVTGIEDMPSDFFREAAREIIRIIFDASFSEEKADPEELIMVFPWRSSLIGAEGAARRGLKRFFHRGVMRDEETLEIKEYFIDIPENIDQNHPENNAGIKVVIFDPMLATGNTMLDAIDRLIRLGVKEENIVLSTIISAPEGVCRVLDKYPGLKIITGSHDQRLNSRGYIVGPGLGDFGDKSFKDLGEPFVEELQEMGVLNSRAATALRKRMGLTSG